MIYTSVQLISSEAMTKAFLVHHGVVDVGGLGGLALDRQSLSNALKKKEFIRKSFVGRYRYACAGPSSSCSPRASDAGGATVYFV